MTFQKNDVENCTASVEENVNVHEVWENVKEDTNSPKEISWKEEEGIVQELALNSLKPKVGENCTDDV